MSAPYRIAVIGCGVVSDMHFVGYLAHPERVQIVAAVDPAPERREHVRSTYGIGKTFASIDELLDAVEFDIAVVCTPSHVRLDTVSVLASRGKHVMVEKPMADSLEEAFKMVQVCEEAGVQLAVDQNFRDHYPFALARASILEGTIGGVIGIDHRDLVYREVTGWRAEAEHHALSVMGVHWFDGFRQLLPDDADWLVARTYRSPSQTAKGETDAFVQMHFGAATVGYTQSFSSRFERTETIVLGERGSLALRYDELLIARDGEPVQQIANPCAGAGKPESAFRSLERLLDAIANHQTPSNSGVDNLRTLSLLHGAYESATTGNPVTLTNGLLQ